MRLSAVSTLDEKEMRNVSGWISVNAALPKESGKYLINIHEETEIEERDFVTEAWYCADKPLSAPAYMGWCLLNEFYDLTQQLAERITHWMPWPDPPGEEADPQ